MSKQNETKSIRTSYKEVYDGNLSIKDYCLVIGDFIKYIMTRVFNGDLIELPDMFGSLYIFGRKNKLEYDENGKVKNQAPDWKKTRELWDECPECREKKQLVYHLNFHSNLYRYKFLWKKRTPLSYYYYMIPSRFNKRYLAKLIKQGKEYKLID